jgi:hypothetical protein
VSRNQEEAKMFNKNIFASITVCIIKLKVISHRMKLGHGKVPFYTDSVGYLVYKNVNYSRNGEHCM